PALVLRLVRLLELLQLRDLVVDGVGARGARRDGDEDGCERRGGGESEHGGAGRDRHVSTPRAGRPSGGDPQRAYQGVPGRSYDPAPCACARSCLADCGPASTCTGRRCPGSWTPPRPGSRPRHRRVTASPPRPACSTPAPAKGLTAGASLVAATWP